MLTLHACLSPQQQQMQQQQQYVIDNMLLYRICMHVPFLFFSYLKWIGLCIGVLSTILRYHLNTAISCAPVVFTAIGNILITSSLLCIITGL